MNEKKMLILHIDYKFIFRSDTDTQTSDTHKNRLFKSIMNIFSTKERNIKLSTKIILNFPSYRESQQKTFNFTMSVRDNFFTLI